MRAGTTIGVAVAMLVAGALAMLWRAPHVAAAGQQAEKSKVMTHMIQGEPMIAALGGGPRLGIQIRDLGKEDLAKFKISSQNGVVVDEVMKDSAAEKAGVKAGDVVVQFDGENVRSTAQLTRLVRETVAGRTVKMGVMRDGKRMDLDVAPAEAENVFNLAVAGERLPNLERHLEVVPERGQVYRFERPTPPPAGSFTWEERVPPPGAGAGAGAGNFVFSMGRGRLGVNVQELTPELAAYFGVKDGLLVNGVQADTPAMKAGIKAGDVIGTVNGKAVASSDGLIKELAGTEGEVTIGVTRDKKALSLKAILEPRKAPARRTVVVGRPA
jgi:C-terminal processing protease CtpA/Prc